MNAGSRSGWRSRDAGGVGDALGLLVERELFRREIALWRQGDNAAARPAEAQICEDIGELGFHPREAHFEFCFLGLDGLLVSPDLGAGGERPLDPCFEAGELLLAGG